MNKIKNTTGKSQIAKAILGYIAMAGVMAIPIAGPIAFMAIADELGIPRRGRRGIYDSLRNLRKRNLVGISKEGNKTVVRLTKEGKYKVLKYKFEDLQINKPGKWDGKWRVVIFDIPEKIKLAREHLRKKLQELGFYKLQKSVWLYPYPCENEIDFINELYEIKLFVRILTVQSIDIQKDLIKHFNL